jgi:hypothetical protein
MLLTADKRGILAPQESVLHLTAKILLSLIIFSRWQNGCLCEVHTRLSCTFAEYLCRFSASNVRKGPLQELFNAFVVAQQTMGRDLADANFFPCRCQLNSNCWKDMIFCKIATHRSPDRHIDIGECAHECRRALPCLAKNSGDKCKRQPIVGLDRTPDRNGQRCLTARSCNAALGPLQRRHNLRRGKNFVTGHFHNTPLS